MMNYKRNHKFIGLSFALALMSSLNCQAQLLPTPTQEALSLIHIYEGKLFQRLALLAEEKTLPFGAVYDYFNWKNNIPVGEEYIADIEKYEAEVLAKRV